MTVLRANDLTPFDLQQLLERLTPSVSETMYCWLDAPDGWALDRWP